MAFKQTKQSKDSMARLGEFKTKHGTVKTPAFFPVGTQAAVKGLSPRELSEIDISGLLVNAYHLYLRPGVKVIQNSGGLHKFMGVNCPIITDSGGYQVFSLKGMRKVSDEGVEFQSHLDGSLHFLSPIDVMKIQLGIGADVIVPLDECIKLPAPKDKVKKALERTLEWARVSKEFFDKEKKDDVLFLGIVQGGTFLDLRVESAEFLNKLNVDGFAIGGLSVGESKVDRHAVLDELNQVLDKDKLRYFMGYGKPIDIIEAVERGIDLFDCVFPTRVARTGTAFSNEGKVVIRNATYTNDLDPIDKECECYVCRDFSRSYLRHLINAKEILGAQLLTYHNVFWYNNLMRRIRKSIEEDRFLEFKSEFMEKYKEEG